MSSKEDLAALATLLRARLDKLKKDEKELGYPLKELRSKITDDLRRVEGRLKEAERRK
jgi:hypothetical protein